MRLLFRTEALEAQRQQWLGRVQLVRPLSLTFFTAGAVALLVLTCCFLSLAHYTRKAAVPGVLVPDRGLVRLAPSLAGTVDERLVAEGQSVKAGDVLFVLTLQRGTFEPGTQARVQRSLEDRARSLQDAARQQQQLMQAQATAVQRRLQALDIELARADAELSLQQQRLVLARQSLTRLEALRNDQFISTAQVQAKGEELLGLEASAQALERQRASLGRERALLEGERDELPLRDRNAQGVIERDLAALARETAEQDAPRQLIVRAPLDGTVASVLAEPGQSVSSTTVLVTLMPGGTRLQAHLFAPSSAVGFVRPDQDVQLRFEAFPYQKYGHQPARVVAVSRAPLAPSELAALALPAGRGERPEEAMFRITVAFDSAKAQAPLPLVAGMRLQGDVMLERRRLVEWLFEPLLGWRDRMT